MKFNRFWKNGKTFQNYDVVPDIVVMGKKGMGGGMPVGALPHQPK
jgi:acetylornithine/succinyldiaminopimelate/putrescine aminotransferase